MLQGWLCLLWPREVLKCFSLFSKQLREATASATRWQRYRNMSSILNPFLRLRLRAVMGSFMTRVKSGCKAGPQWRRNKGASDFPGSNLSLHFRWAGMKDERRQRWTVELSCPFFRLCVNSLPQTTDLFAMIERMQVCRNCSPASSFVFAARPPSSALAPSVLNQVLALTSKLKLVSCSQFFKSPICPAAPMFFVHPVHVAVPLFGFLGYFHHWQAPKGVSLAET